jgi:hypothetical protein
VGEIAAELQGTRRALLRYTFDQDEVSFAEAEKRLSKIADFLDDAVKATISEERRSIYRDSVKDIAELKTKRLALGEAIKQMQAGRALLFTDGDKMAADVQKFVDAADKTDFTHEANALESKVLLVRVANWRMLATRDVKGLVTFKTNVEKAQQQIAALEKASLPSNLAALLAPVKASVGIYAEAFDKTGPNLLLGDELYYKAITPVIVDTITKMDGTKAGIGQAFHKMTTDTEDRITTTITTQGVGRRRGCVDWPADRVPDRSRNHRPAVRPDLRHEGTRWRQFRRGASRPRPQGRSRRHGAGGRDLQGQGRRPATKRKPKLSKI